MRRSSSFVKVCRLDSLCQRCCWFGHTLIATYITGNAITTQPPQEIIAREMSSTREVLWVWDLAEGLPEIDSLVRTMHECRKRKSLSLGKYIHTHICSYGLESHKLLGNYIVPMLVDCGSLCNAQQVFQRLLCKNEFSWTALIQGYFDSGNAQCALDLFVLMVENSIHPSAHTFVVVLKCCAKLTCIKNGWAMHTEIIKEGLDRELFVGNILLFMYAKCGSDMEAWKVFDNLPVQDRVSWSALIAGYTECSLGEKALMCFRQMQLEGMSQDGITYICCLKACCDTKNLVRGREIHMEIAEQWLEEDLYVGNTLLDMYAKCDSLVEAREVFNRLPVQDVVSWTALIVGYADHGFDEEVLDCFEQMQLKGASPNTVTFVSALRACSNLGDIKKSLEIHVEVVKKGFELETPLGGHVVNAYSKCGSLAEAEMVFDSLLGKDVGAWNALLVGYAECGLGDEAFARFRQMQLEGVSPDVVSWNTVIMGYAEQKQSDKAFNMVMQMQEQGLLPNNMTFVSILKACGDTSALGHGKKAHTHLYKPTGSAEATDINLMTALFDMYGRCGSMIDAQQVFDVLLLRDLVACNALITGYAHQGETGLIFFLLNRLKEEGVRPDATTFLSVLNACNHMGLLQEGYHYFHSMSKDYGLTPSIRHLNCMLDLLGRAGHLSEVVVMSEQMPFHPDLAARNSVAGALVKCGVF